MGRPPVINDSSLGGNTIHSPECRLVNLAKEFSYSKKEIA